MQCTGTFSIHLCRVNARSPRNVTITSGSSLSWLADCMQAFDLNRAYGVFLLCISLIVRLLRTPLARLNYLSTSCSSEYNKRKKKIPPISRRIVRTLYVSTFFTSFCSPRNVGQSISLATKASRRTALCTTLTFTTYAHILAPVKVSKAR